MGRHLLKGQVNLINVSMPVTFFEARSYLQKLTDPWIYPAMLDKAAAAVRSALAQPRAALRVPARTHSFQVPRCSTLDPPPLPRSQSADPVERMKWVMTFFIAGMQHVFATWAKPFNPILGETWQGELSDGSTVFLEQISHHPPVSAWYMEAKDSKESKGPSWRFVGTSNPQASMYTSCGALPLCRRSPCAAPSPAIRPPYAAQHGLPGLPRPHRAPPRPHRDSPSPPMAPQVSFKWNSLTTIPSGFRRIEFPRDKGCIELHFPSYVINNVIRGTPQGLLKGEMSFIDNENNLEGVIHFAPVKASRLASRAVVRHPTVACSCTASGRAAAVTTAVVMTA